jgi:hypothetical protein
MLFQLCAEDKIYNMNVTSIAHWRHVAIPKGRNCEKHDIRCYPTDLTFLPSFMKTSKFFRKLLYTHANRQYSFRHGKLLYITAAIQKRLFDRDVMDCKGKVAALSIKRRNLGLALDDRNCWRMESVLGIILHGQCRRKE